MLSLRFPSCSTIHIFFFYLDMDNRLRSIAYYSGNGS